MPAPAQLRSSHTHLAISVRECGREPQRGLGVNRGQPVARTIINLEQLRELHQQNTKGGMSRRQRNKNYKMQRQQRFRTGKGKRKTEKDEEEEKERNEEEEYEDEKKEEEE